MSIRRSGWIGLYITALLVCSSAAAEPSARIVRVSGYGIVSAQPDKAFVTLGVESRKPALDDARAEVSATVDRVLALTRELGIDSKQVEATRLSIQPEYSWLEKERKRVMLGYIVGRQVDVELRDLEKLGALLERSVDVGINQVSGPVLDSSRRDELQRQAMAKAVADARLNAETLARAAGAQLGPVRDLDVTGVPARPTIAAAPRYAAADAAMAIESVYQAGELDFTTTVTAAYDLVP